jgi:hypothetical protein
MGAVATMINPGTKMKTGRKMKTRTTLTLAAAVAVVLYGGSLYVYSVRTAASARAAALQADMHNRDVRLQNTISREQQQIALDQKAVSQLQAELKSVKGHSQATLQDTALLNHAIAMLQQGKPLSEVIKLVKSSKVPVALPTVSKVTVQHVSVSSSPPPVTTVSRGSAP